MGITTSASFLVDSLFLEMENGRSRDWSTRPDWSYLRAEREELQRTRCQNAVVALLGLRRFRRTLLSTHPTDVILLVAGVLWSSRLGSDWNDNQDWVDNQEPMFKRQRAEQISSMRNPFGQHLRSFGAVDGADEVVVRGGRGEVLPGSEGGSIAEREDLAGRSILLEDVLLDHY
jgi:hypothetical protein